jgi:hypothetical protein
MVPKVVVTSCHFHLANPIELLTIMKRSCNSFVSIDAVSGEILPTCLYKFLIFYYYEVYLFSSNYNIHFQSIHTSNTVTTADCFYKQILYISIDDRKELKNIR